MTATNSPPPVPSGSPRHWRTTVALTALACTPALLIGADQMRWDWLGPFLGRFHPVVLHFPIALLLLAALLEIGQIATRDQRRFPVAFVLFLGSTSAVAAASLGWLLMRADAVEGARAEQHLQGGLAVAAMAVATLLVRLLPGIATRAALRWAYRGLLFATCALLVRTAHDGASLTHGDGYLSEHAPWWTPPAPPEFAFPTDQPIAQWDIYGHVVTPILQARCLECHRPDNVKGGLVLDDFAALLRGGKSGAVLVAGEPAKSRLLQRLNLPIEHKEHMPPRRRAQPTPEEIALLRRWIALGAPAQGALGEIGLDGRLLAVTAQLPTLLRSKRDAAEDAMPQRMDPAAVAKLRADHAAEVARLQTRYPHVLAYESRQSADLRLNAGNLGSSFGDDDVAAFAAVRDRIVWADLSGTAITDRSAPALAAMKRLVLLRLARTAITDAAAETFATLNRLESLNVFATRVTAAALPAFNRLGALQRLYVGETAIPAGAPCPDPLREKIRFQKLTETDEPKLQAAR